MGKSVILTDKNLLLHQAPLLAAWQSSTATVWLVDAVGSYLFAWHKDVPQRSADRRCQHAVSLLTTPAFCTWKCHSRGLDGLEKRCLTLSLCSTSVSLISFCVFLCVPQTTTRHCQRQNTTEKSITCLTSRPITCWHENAPFKNKKDKKKPAYQCLSSLSGMSQMSIFFPHFIQKAHLVCSRLCGWVFACVYVHRWEWFKSRFGVVVFSGFPFLGSRNRFLWCVRPCDAPEWTMQNPKYSPSIFVSMLQWNPLTRLTTLQKAM